MITKLKATVPLIEVQDRSEVMAGRNVPSSHRYNNDGNDSDGEEVTHILRNHHGGSLRMSKRPAGPSNRLNYSDTMMLREGKGDRLALSWVEFDDHLLDRIEVIIGLNSLLSS